MPRRERFNLGVSKHCIASLMVDLLFHYHKKSRVRIRKNSVQNTLTKKMIFHIAKKFNQICDCCIVSLFKRTGKLHNDFF